MTAEQMRHTVGQIFNSLFNNHRLELIDQIYAERFLVTDAANGLSDHPGDRDMIRDMVQMYRDAFSDLHYTVHDITADGGGAMCTWTFRGTFDGPLMNVQPNHEIIEMAGCSKVSFDADGQVATVWQLWDARKVQELLARAAAAAATEGEAVAFTSESFKPAAHAMSDRPSTGKTSTS